MKQRRGPDYVQFYPTLRCDRSCGFCFNRHLPVLPDMPFRDFERMLERLPDTVRALDIIGGEPTLHPEVLPMLQEATRRMLPVNISSNGGRVGMLEQIAAMPGVSLGISINDRDTLAELRSFIAKFSPVVKTVHTRSLDAGLIHEILALSPRHFYLIYRDALHPADLAETVPFPDFLESARELAAGAQAFGTVFCSGFLPDTAACPELGATRCPAGTTKLGILPDGSVYPCNLFFGQAGFLLGNILKDPFETIWNHPALDFFRRFDGNVCPRSSCTLHGTCHGGCPAQGLLLAGRLAAPDPRCSGPEPGHYTGR